MAAHVNVTFAPSSAVVLAGCTVIIGGEDFLGNEVTGFSLSGSTIENVTGAKKIANNQVINKDIQGNIIENWYFNFNLNV